MRLFGKNSDSKAASKSLAASPCRPIRAVFSVGKRWVIEPVHRFCRLSFPLALLTLSLSARRLLFPQQLGQLRHVCRDPPRLVAGARLRRRIPAPGSVHGVVDEEDYNDGTQNNHPIGNLSASYGCFSLKPFHDLHPRLGLADISTYVLIVFGWCSDKTPGVKLRSCGLYQ
jgi:hypothetical protein